MGVFALDSFIDFFLLVLPMPFVSKKILMEGEGRKKKRNADMKNRFGGYIWILRRRLRFVLSFYLVACKSASPWIQ